MQKTNSIKNRAIFYDQAARRLAGERGLRLRLAEKPGRGARNLTLAYRLGDPLALDKALNLAEPLALFTHTRIVLGTRRDGLVCYQFELRSADWRWYTRQQLTRGPGVAGVGLADDYQQVNFEFADDRPHAGVFGASGAGKSVTVQSILCGLFTAYQPDELQAVIIDPDGDHVGFDRVAHLAGLPIAHTDEQISHSLEYANAELKRRANAGARDARRLLVTIDEAEKVLADARLLGIARAIAKDGRKFNMRLLLACQNPNERTLPDLLQQVTSRWVGLVSDARTSAYLTGHARIECHKLSGRGDFVHLAGGDPVRLLVAKPEGGDFDDLPRAEIAPPDFEPSEPMDAEEQAEERHGKGRRPDVFDFHLAGRLAARLGIDAGLSDGTLANRLGIGLPKLQRHRGPAEKILAGLRDEYGAWHNGKIAN